MTFFRAVKVSPAGEVAARYVATTNREVARRELRAWRDRRDTVWLWKVGTFGPQRFAHTFVRALNEGHIRISWQQVQIDRRGGAYGRDYAREGTNTSFIHTCQPIPATAGGVVTPLPPQVIMDFEEEDAALKAEGEHL